MERFRRRRRRESCLNTLLYMKLQFDRLRESEGTLACDHYPRLEIVEYFTPTMTWHFHIIKKSMLVVSCHVMSWVVICHITIVDHVYCIQNDCKVEFQRTHMECKESCKLNCHRKSNSHEGSQRVTLGYIYSLIVWAKEFSPWLLPYGIKEIS